MRHLDVHEDHIGQRVAARPTASEPVLGEADDLDLRGAARSASSVFANSEWSSAIRGRAPCPLGRQRACARFGYARGRSGGALRAAGPTWTVHVGRTPRQPPLQRTKRQPRAAFARSRTRAPSTTRVEQARGQRSSEPATVPRPVTCTATRRSGRKTAPTVAVALTSSRQDGSRAPAHGPVHAEPNHAPATRSICTAAAVPLGRARSRSPARRARCRSAAAGDRERQRELRGGVQEPARVLDVEPLAGCA